MKTKCNNTYMSFEAIVLKLIYNALAAGLHQVTQPEMDVIF